MRPLSARGTGAALRGAAALLVGLLIAVGFTVPAQAAETTIYGQVFLGSTSSSVTAGAGEVLVEYTKYPNAHNPADFVATAADGTYLISGLASGTYYLRYHYVGSGSFSDMGTKGAVPGYVQWEEAVAPSSTTPRNVYLPALAELGGNISLGQAGSPAGAGEVMVYYQRLIDSAWAAESAGVPTDAAGHYSFGLMPAGIYTFRFDYVGAGDFVGRTWVDGPSQVLGKRAGYFRGASAPFSADAVLRAPITISGQVNLSDSLDLQPAAPAGAGVTVSYARKNFENGVVTPLGSTTTDASGQFSIPGLVDMYGYVLTYSAPGYFPFTTQPDGSWAHGYASFSVSQTLARSYTVTGHIDLGSVRSAGAGDVIVTFSDAGHSYYGGTATTDSEGNYSISGLPALGYIVTLDYTGVDGFLDHTPDLPIPRDGTKGVWTPTPDSSVLDLVVPGGNTVSGAVYSPSRLPLANATVTLYEFVQYSSSYSLASRGTATTAADGTYSFGSLPDGFYGVGFYYPGYAYQSWPGWSSFYDPGVIELWGGEPQTGIDATMQLPASISGRVSGPNLASIDYSTHRVSATLLVRDDATGNWVYADTAYMDGGGNYSFTGLVADQYRVRVSYVGPQGVATSLSAPLTVAANQTLLFNATLNMTPQLTPGDRVKGSGSIVYLVNQPGGPLIPLGSPTAATDAGYPASVKTIPQAQIDNYTISDAPLSSIINCGYGVYLAAEGKLWPIAAELVLDLPWTYLTTQACGGLPIGSSVIDSTLFLSSPAGVTYYIGSDAQKHKVLSAPTLAIVAAPYTPRVYRVNDAFLSSIPTGTAILPVGSTVKGPGPKVYFVAGFNHLVPLQTWEPTIDMGLPASFSVVSQADLDQAVIDPDSQSLSNVLICGAVTYVASSGKLWPVDAALVAALPKTTLDASACSVLPKATTTVSGALFLQPTNGSTVYSVGADGSKRHVMTAPTLGMLAAPATPTVLKVGASFINALPTGTKVLPPGSMVKGPGPRVYFVAGFNHLVPLQTWEPTIDMGLPTSFLVVTQADLDQAVIDPDSQSLSNVLICGAVTYVASSGKLWPISSSLVAALPKTTLDASACSQLPKATTTVAGALFLQPTTSSSVYSVGVDGSKRHVMTAPTLGMLAAPATPTVLKVGASFVNALPTGTRVLPPGSMVKGPGPRVYFVAGFNHLVPLQTWEPTIDMGLPTSYLVVTQADLDQAVIDPDSQSLSNVVICGSVTYVASSGKLWPVDAALVAALPKTTLDASACSVLPKATTTVAGALFLQPSGSSTVYAVGADGSKRHVLTAPTLGLLAAPAAPTVLKVGASFVNALPTGTKVLPVGSMVKGPGPSVYFVAGFQHLVPLKTWEATSDMGLPSSFLSVSQADVDQAVIDPSTQTLSNVLVCGSISYLASAGRLWPVAPSLVAGLPKTTLDSSACSVLPKAATTVQGALFITSVAGGATYQVMPDGTRRVVAASALALLAAPYAPQVLKVNASFLSAIPASTG